MAATSLSLEPERFSRLVSLGYEAPAHDTRAGQRDAWRRFTAEAAEALGCQLAVFESYDRGRPGDSIIATGGLDGFEEVFSGFRTRTQADKYWVAMHNQPAGMVSLGSEILPPDEMRKTRLYSSVAMPWHLEHFLIGKIHDAVNGGAFFTLARTDREPPFEAGDKSLIGNMLLTHLHRSMTLHTEVAAMRATNSILASVMQQAPTGLVIFDALGKPVVVNQRASEIFAAGDGLALINGQLRATSSLAQVQLDLALSAVLQCCAGRPVPAPPSVLVARRAGGQPYRVTFSVLGSPGRGSGNVDAFPRGSSVVAVVHEEQRANGSSLPALFRTTYGLTRAEIRLCETLLAGQSLAEAADALGVSRNTAKTHLTRVFDKTGVRSQMALLRLLTLGAQA